MKKFLFALLTVACSFSLLRSQTYTVYMVGNIGYHFDLAQDTMPDMTDLPLDMSEVGPDLVWNFQGLDPDVLDTINFVDLTGQEQTDFPAGNLVMESNFVRIVFDRDVLSGLYLHGSSLSFAGNDLSLNYVPAQRTIPATCNLGTQDSTTSYIEESVFVGIDTTIFTCNIVIDSIMIKRRAIYHIEFDAEGELRLPNDTFPSSLRAVTSEYTIDSIFVYCPNGINPVQCFGISAPIGWSLAPDALIQLSGFADSAVTHGVTHAASWYVENASSPVCIVDIIYDPGFSDTSYVGVRYSNGQNADIGFETINSINLNVYPNPANNLIYLQTADNITNASMYFYNAQGQLVKSVGLNGANTVDVTGLSNGMYFYRLVNDKTLLHQGKMMIKK